MKLFDKQNKSILYLEMKEQQKVIINIQPTQIFEEYFAGLTCIKYTKFLCFTGEIMACSLVRKRTRAGYLQGEMMVTNNGM